MSQQRTCPSCGHALTRPGAYCSKCGALLADPTPPPAADPTPAPARKSAWEVILEKLRESLAPRYRVIRLLGYGGMAGVYLAEESRLGRRVAIKVISPSLMVDPAQAERFEQEARTTAQLDHPNIVTVYEVDERDGLHFFTMTHVPGRTLSHVLRETAVPLEIRVVRAWLGQVASALAYAHRRGVVHRDIKPGNILLDEAGNALVGDFGIAKVQDQEGLTRTGMLVGTPAYMSPEQCTTGSVTGASDQYSLGAVAYQMITGRAPFEGPTMAIINAHLATVPRPLRELRDECPLELEEAVLRMLAKQPEDRFPVLEAALDALSGGPLRYDDPARARMAELARWTERITVDVEPPTTTQIPVAPGERFTIRAVPRAGDGTPLLDRRVEWTTDPGEVLEVGADGSVLALRNGHATIVARTSGVTEHVAVTVAGAPAAEKATGAPPEPAHAAPAGIGPPPALVPPPDRPAWEPRVEPDAPDAVEDRPDGPHREREPHAPYVSHADTGPATPWPDYEAAPVAPPAADPAPWRAAAERESAAPSFAAPAADAAPDRGVSPSTRAAGAAPLPWEIWLRSPVVLGGAAAVVAVVALVAWAVLGGGGPPTGASGEDVETAAEAPAVDAPSGAAAEVAGGGAAEAGGAEGTPEVSVGREPPAGAPAAGRDEVAAPTSAEAEPPPEPVREEPLPGTLILGGQLPAGADIRVSGNGVDRSLAGGAATLPPGTYTIAASAPGYERVTGSVQVRAGATTEWTASWVQLPAAPAPAPEPADPPPAAGPSPAEDRAAVLEAVQAFARALEARDIGALRAAYPSIPAQDAAQWETFFGTRELRNLGVEAVPRGEPTLDGDTAVLAFDLTLRYTLPGGAAPAQPVPYRATFVRAPEGWVIDRLEQVG